MYLFLFAINIKRLWRLGIVRNNDSINIQSLRDFLYNEEMRICDYLRSIRSIRGAYRIKTKDKTHSPQRKQINLKF